MDVLRDCRCNGPKWSNDAAIVPGPLQHPRFVTEFQVQVQASASAGASARCSMT